MTNIMILNWFNIALGSIGNSLLAKASLSSNIGFGVTAVPLSLSLLGLFSL